MVTVTLVGTLGCARQHAAVAQRPSPIATMIARPTPTAAAIPTVPAKSTARPTSTATATAPTVAPSAATVATADRVAAAVVTATAGRDAVVDVAVEDLTKGETAEVGAGVPVRAASLTKLLILRALAAGRPLSETERRDAVAMIERSDNNAATRLWRAAGGDAALSAVVAAARMTHTIRVPVLLFPWDGWVTTAADQLRLLHTIATGRDTGSGLLRSLMAQVSADQAWGAGSVPGGSQVIVKNGWLPVSGQWVVNTDGCMRIAGDAVCVAVTSSGSPTMAAGVATVDAVARAAASAVTGGAATGTSTGTSTAALTTPAP